MKRDWLLRRIKPVSILICEKLGKGGGGKGKMRGKMEGGREKHTCQHLEITNQDTFIITLAT